MKTFKDQLKNYMHTKEAHAEVDVVLKENVYSMLSRSPRSRVRWWKLIFPLMTVVTVVVIFITIQVQPNTNESLSETIVNSLRPQEALAAALQQVVNLETLNSSFGLPNDNQLHHRKLEFSYTYPTVQESGLPQSASESINLWTDGSNTREDVDLKSSETESIVNSYSRLWNVSDQLYCIGDHIGQQQECNLATERDMTSMIDPITVPDHENLINDFTVTAFDGTDQDPPGLLFTWTSEASMENWLIDLMNYGTGNGIGMGSNERTQNDDGTYSYSAKIYDDVLIRSGNLYIQIKQVNNNDQDVVLNSSMVYQLNSTTLALTPVTSSMLESAIGSEEDIRLDIMKGPYMDSLKPILYVLSNPERFSTPISITETTKNSTSATVYRFPLTNHYLSQSRTYLTDPTDNQFWIDLYLDSSNSTFLGYVITVNDKIAQQAWLTDEILPADQVNTIFDIDRWKETF